MNISLEHGLQYDHERRAYWIRIKFSGEPNKKSTLLVLASKNYIADHYAGSKEVSNEHTALWMQDVIKDVESIPDDAFFINQVYRKVYADTAEGQKNGMDFLAEVLP